MTQAQPFCKHCIPVRHSSPRLRISKSTNDITEAGAYNKDRPPTSIYLGEQTLRSPNSREERGETERVRAEDPEATYLRGSTEHRSRLTLAVVNSLPSNAEKEEWMGHIRAAREEGCREVDTDGSRVKERAGAGWVVEGRESSVYLGYHATTNDAELLAMSEIGKAENAGVKRGDEGGGGDYDTYGLASRNLEPTQDSRRVPDVGTLHPLPPVAIITIITIITGGVGRKNKKGEEDIAVMWIKGHKGIPGNEEADVAAKIGTALQYEREVVTEIQKARGERAAERNRLGMNYKPLQRRIGTHLPYHDEVVTEAGIRQLSRAWRAMERNRLELTYRPLTRLGWKVSAMAGLLGGKSLRKWQFDIRKTESPECWWCGEEEETTEHILDRCRTWKRRWPGEWRTWLGHPRARTRTSWWNC
ncbi:hypothetical protein BDZ91DRAFT_793895 [Kalaharituber pfeilii]|nr:hypothetical protein BDZ91DRAFT_793895 [Kalaharituber pfeilii]